MARIERSSARRENAQEANSQRPERLDARVVLRYTALQLPGWILTVLILFWIKDLALVPMWTLWVIGGTWIVKDIVLFPLVWRAYAGDGSEGIREPVGHIGICSNRLTPRGSVHVLGETWEAINEDEQLQIEVGSAVRITERNGLVLHVRAENGASSEQDHDGGGG